jgi:membrane protein YdbS with pleckstrin-like domain
MLCPSCNADVPADAVFCPKCGQKIGGATAATPLAAIGPTAAEKFRAMQPAGTQQPEPEHDLWQGRYSPKAMYGNWVLAAVLSVAAIVLAILVPNPVAWIAAAVVIPVIWLGLLLLLLVRRMSIEYTLTTQRFIDKRGLLSREVNQILLVDVDDVTYKQSFIGRLFNFGTIILRAKDESLRAENAASEAFTLVPVDDVQRVANMIDETRREERRKRAIYMATV